VDPDHAHQEPSDEPSGNAIKRALERHRRSLPWSDRRILAVSLVVVLILVPVWLDPSTLTKVTGGNPTPAPTPTSATATSQPPLDSATEPPLTDDAVVAADAFTRNVATGWGSADIGGPYTVTGDGALSVGSGQGSVVLGSSANGSAVLASVVARDVIVEHSVTTDPTLTGELRDVSLLRVIGTANYAVVVRLDPSGVLVGVERTIGGQTELIGRFVSVADTSTRSSAPDMRIHAEAGGAEPTTIRVRVWPVSEPEPNVWQLTMVDWAGTLQTAGAVGLGWQSTSGASGALHFSDLTAWVTGEAAQ